MRQKSLITCKQSVTHVTAQHPREDDIIIRWRNQIQFGFINIFSIKSTNKKGITKFSKYWISISCLLISVFESILLISSKFYPVRRLECIIIENYRAEVSDVYFDENFFFHLQTDYVKTFWVRIYFLTRNHRISGQFLTALTVFRRMNFF